MALSLSSLSLPFSLFRFALFTSEQSINQKKQHRNTMLLGKRQRPQIKRTTSLSEMKLDLNLPSGSEPSDHQGQLVTVDEHLQAHQRLLDQRLLSMVSPRGTQRKYSADCSEGFLRTCSLCKRHLVPGRDIYMYRGDRAFCSSECRQQQITVDERKEEKKKKKGLVGSTVVVAAEGETVSAAVILKPKPSRQEEGNDLNIDGAY